MSAAWIRKALGVLFVLGLAAQVALPVAAQTAPVPQLQQATLARAAGEYRLGTGDLVRITVFQNPELTLETRVGDTGQLSYPLLGSLPVAGLGVERVEALIADGLRRGGFVRSPQVNLTVLQVRGHQANVLGQVNRPGRYPLETQGLRLSDLLALAGGVALGGGERIIVTGVRAGQTWRHEVELPQLFGPEGAKLDPPVQDGDTVFVDRQPTVYIYGEVQRPGQLRLERDMSLLQALAAGGGLTTRGTERGIRIHRRTEDGTVQVLQAGPGERLRDGDVVFVRESLF